MDLLLTDLQPFVERELSARHVTSGPPRSPPAGATTSTGKATAMSRTSTSPQFLERVQPSFAIVSSGYRNSYGHPHPDVIRRLKRRGVSVLRTDQDGRVSVLTDGDRLFVSTFRWEGPGRNPATLTPLADADE